MANPLPGNLRGLGKGPGPLQNQPAPPHPGTTQLAHRAKKNPLKAGRRQRPCGGRKGLGAKNALRRNRFQTHAKLFSVKPEPREDWSMTQEPRENRLEALAVSTSAPDVGSPELRELNSFGLLHLFSAAHFSRQVAELERLHANEPLGKFWDELFALSTACVFCCVAGLEGYANELFVLHCDTLRQDRPQWSEDRWRKVEMKPILSKYDLATKLLKTKK